MSHLEAMDWSPRAALTPCIAISAAFTYSLYILSTPSHYRLESLALVSVLVAVFENSSNDLYPDDLLNAVFAYSVLIWLVHIFHVTIAQGSAGYISGSSTRTGDQGLKERGWTVVSAPGLSPYHKAYKMLWNPRGIGTSWQVLKTLQPGVQDGTTKIHSRRAFLRRRLLTIICRYIALAVFYEVSESDMLTQPGPLTGREIVGRTHIVIHFIVHNWLWIATVHECLSIVFIYVLRLDEPHEWPPMYGSLLEAYTVRRFWAHFWHRIAYAPFRAMADGLSARIFGRGNRGAARRLVNVALVFLLSGLLHSIMDWKGGLCNCWATGLFYFVQPVGFVLETLAQSSWASLSKRMFAPGSRMLSGLQRAVGYMWVWTWLFLLYPQRTAIELNCRAKA